MIQIVAVGCDIDLFPVEHNEDSIAVCTQLVEHCLLRFVSDIGVLL